MSFPRLYFARTCWGTFGLVPPFKMNFGRIYGMWETFRCVRSVNSKDVCRLTGCAGKGCFEADSAGGW